MTCRGGGDHRHHARSSFLLPSLSPMCDHRCCPPPVLPPSLLFHIIRRWEVWTEFPPTHASIFPESPEEKPWEKNRLRGPFFGLPSLALCAIPSSPSRGGERRDSFSLPPFPPSLLEPDGSFFERRPCQGRETERPNGGGSPFLHPPFFPLRCSAAAAATAERRRTNEREITEKKGRGRRRRRGAQGKKRSGRK